MSVSKSPKLSVLIVEDDPMISLMIAKILELNGYAFREARDGEEALKVVESEAPDLMILDINMPKINGYEVCRRLRNDSRFQKTPILMITASADRLEQVKGIEVGADDFIVKPFNYDELLTRVLSTIKRKKKDLDANPLTYLPGNSSTERMVLGAIQNKKPFAVLKVDLKNFKAYNERYGFPRGDEAIRSTARILLSSIDQEKDFLGHAGADDFFVITEPVRAEGLCRKIIKEFNRISPGFYELEDNRKGFIETVNRQGSRQKFPFMSIFIGVVLDPDGQFESLGMIQKICDEVLVQAKKNPESSYLINRRQVKPTEPGKPPKKKPGKRR